MRVWLPLVLLTAASTGHSQEIDRVRQEIAAKPDAGSSAGSGGSSSKSDDGMWDDLGREVVGPLFLGALAAPFWVPGRLIEGSNYGDDLWDWNAYGQFARHPFADGSVGSLSMDPAGGRSTRLRIATDYGGNFRGLERYHAEVQLDTSHARLGLHQAVDWFSENGGRDGLGIVGTHATLRFVQSSRWLLHAGIGANVLADGTTTKAGFDFRYSALYYAAKPVSLEAALEWGGLGAAFSQHYRIGANFHWGRWEAALGYDARLIGGAALNGPFAGVGVNF